MYELTFKVVYALMHNSQFQNKKVIFIQLSEDSMFRGISIVFFVDSKRSLGTEAPDYLINN